LFDHVTVRVLHHHASRRFYKAVLDPLGHRISSLGGHFCEWNDFHIAQARAGRALTRRLHVAFVARSHAEVDAFWRVGTSAGYASDGEPGLRPEYEDHYYGSFLLDPDGNSVEAVYHGRDREGRNVIDHLWIRVADLEASKRFYETIVPSLGLRIAKVLPERFHVAGRDRSFALCAASRARTFTLRSQYPSARESSSFTTSPSAPAIGTTAVLASGVTAPGTTARPSSTPMAITSRSWLFHRPPD
jgi:catechol 2,3-dioxygenase-like lactoylglutathione lyase family enzyme